MNLHNLHINVKLTKLFLLKTGKQPKLIKLHDYYLETIRTRTFETRVRSNTSPYHFYQPLIQGKSRRIV